jgi:hypothetical protein
VARHLVIGRSGGAARRAIHMPCCKSSALIPL